MDYAYDELSREGLYVSADVFGTIIRSGQDAQAVGQDYREMAGRVDYLCPMIYPSHYGDGSFGIEHPDTQPYDTVYQALLGSREALAGERRTAARRWCDPGSRILPLPIWTTISTTGTRKSVLRFRRSTTPDMRSGFSGMREFPIILGERQNRKEWKNDGQNPKAGRNLPAF